MKLLTTLMLGMLLAFSAYASDSSSDNNNTNYLGIKGGRMLVAFDNTSGAASPGFIAGRTLNERFSIEASFIKGYPLYKTGAAYIDSSGKVAYTPDYAHDKLNTNVYALYLNYRTLGDWYFMAKGGVAHADMESNEFVPGISNTAFSGGIGFGWRAGKEVHFEAEVTHIDKNLRYIGITGILLGF